MINPPAEPTTSVMAHDPATPNYQQMRDEFLMRVGPHLRADLPTAAEYGLLLKTIQDEEQANPNGNRIYRVGSELISGVSHPRLMNAKEGEEGRIMLYREILFDVIMR